MPNWKTHIEVAKRINRKLNLSNKKAEEFYFGNILPDINNCYIVTDISKKLEHKYTHYQDEEKIPSYQNFKNIYKDKIYKEPLLLGFYTHLFTDYTWNNYFYTNFNNHKKLKEMSHTEKRKIKQDDFKVYNDLFIKNTLTFKNKENLLKKSKEIDRISITIDDINKVEKFLKEQKKSNYQFKILSIEILDNMMEKTIKSLEKEINQHCT